jgi:hypothetical protein
MIYFKKIASEVLLWKQSSKYERIKVGLEHEYHQFSTIQKMFSIKLSCLYVRDFSSLACLSCSLKFSIIFLLY